MATKRLRDLQKHGLRKVYAKPLGNEDVQIRELKDEVVSLRKKIEGMEYSLASRAVAFNIQSYKLVLMRRLLQEWSKSRIGKKVKGQLTESLKKAYLDLGLSFASPAVDFLTEYKFTLKQLNKQADEDGIDDSQHSEMFHTRLGIFQSVLMKEIAGLTPEGFESILNDYLNANQAVHSDFTQTELGNLIADVESRELMVGQGGPWVTRLVNDLVSSRQSDNGLGRLMGLIASRPVISYTNHCRTRTEGKLQ